MWISSPFSSPEKVSVRSFSVALKVKVFFVTLPSDSGELWPLRVRVPVSVSPLTVRSRTSAGPAVGVALPFAGQRGLGGGHDGAGQQESGGESCSQHVNLE